MILWLLSLCFWLQIDTSAKCDQGPVESRDDVTNSSRPDLMPYFDDPASVVNMTVHLGSSAVLHCRVSELTDKTTVSWLRRQAGQLRLVSVGLDVYSGDARFTVALLEPNDWTLGLQAVQEGDEGVYECQVSSHPPLLHTLYLHVVVPELQIWDERGIPIRNKFYNAGSRMELKCSILKVPKPTHFILWRRGTSILNYDVSRGGISVKTDMGADGLKSRLLIAAVGPQDSGNYTCQLEHVAQTSVLVHVLNGERPAAIQHGSSSGLSPAPLLVMLLAFSLLGSR